MENLNAGRRATASASNAASGRGGKFFTWTLEKRTEARRVARGTLERAAFFKCCWEILVFRVMREAAEDALALILWGDLRGDLVETCSFPTTLARIHALDEAETPEYHNYPAGDSSSGDSEESTADMQLAVQALTATADGESAALCQFCIRRSRRTCFCCHVSLCSSHAFGG